MTVWFSADSEWNRLNYASLRPIELLCCVVWRLHCRCPFAQGCTVAVLCVGYYKRVSRHCASVCVGVPSTVTVAGRCRSCALGTSRPVCVLVRAAPLRLTMLPDGESVGAPSGRPSLDEGAIHEAAGHTGPGGPPAARAPPCRRCGGFSPAVTCRHLHPLFLCCAVVTLCMGSAPILRSPCGTTSATGAVSAGWTAQRLA